jgi:hypothetical protein
MLFKVIWSHVLPFESPMVQSYFQMQSSWKDQLHEQKFLSLLANTLLGVMWTHFHSCVGLAIGAWLLTCLNTPSFHLSSTHFFIMLCICFGIPHPMVTHLLVWSHHQWFGYPFSMLPMWMNTLQPMICFKISLQLLCWRMELTYKKFSSPYTKTNGYCCHQRRFLYLGGHCHC